MKSEVPRPTTESLAAQDGSPLRVEPFHFADLSESAEFCKRVDLTAAHVRSLRAHPYARPDDTAGLLLLRGEKCVGRYALLPGRMRIGDRELPVVWGSNWNVDLTNSRNRAGAGLLLLMATRRAKNFVGCGPSDLSRPVFVAARFQFLRLPRRAALLRSKAFLSRRMPPRLASLAAAFIDPSLRMLELGRRVHRRHRSGFQLESVDRFDDRIDEIDTSSRGRWCFPRDHRELNWALRNPWLPSDQYKLTGYYLRDASGVVGYALARVRVFNGLRLGSIVRSGVRATETGRAPAALLALLHDVFEEDAVDIFDIATTNPLMLAAADSYGLQSRGATEIVARFDREVSAALAQESATLESFSADMGEGDVIFA